MATLKSQLETKGPGWYSPAEREERLFTNKSNGPGDDMKEAHWWRPCGVASLVYYAEPALAVTPICSTLGVSGRTRNFPWHVYASPGGRTNNFPSIYPHSGGCIYERTKEEEAGWRQCPDWVATMLRVLVYGTSIGGVMLRQGLASTWRWNVFGHLVLWPIYLKRVALFCPPPSHWKLECLDGSSSGTYR